MATNSEREHGTFCGRTRREFLWEAGGGFTGVALASMLFHALQVIIVCMA